MSEGSQTNGHAGSPRREAITFHGTGEEYFRIWIVNLVLSIVTLGVYSAWAKVRTNRYFYGNTELAGDRFYYLADPITILRGRLIAVAALIGYTIMQNFMAPVWGIAAFFALLLAIPFFVVRALKFRTAMTMWRGLRMSFSGGPGEAFLVYVVWPVIGVFTLGLAMPYAWYARNEYLINHYHYGDQRSRATAGAASFYGIALMLFGFAVVSILAVSALGVLTMVAPAAGQGVLAIVLAMFSVGIYAGVFIVYQVGYHQVVFDHIRIPYAEAAPGQGNLVRTDVQVGAWAWIALTNTVFMVLTLGLYYPWASVRMTRYKLEHTWVDAHDLEGYRADPTGKTDALGDEIGEAFDLGIGV